MHTRVIIGNSAYACITTPTRQLDVLLTPGKSAAKSLEESAAEMREKAAKLIAQAELIEEAIPQFREQARKRVREMVKRG